MDTFARLSAFILILLIPVVTSDDSAEPAKGSTYCEAYNATSCTGTEEDCSKLEQCSPPAPGKRNHCYVVWHHNHLMNTSTIKSKGCTQFDSKDCYDKKHCVEDSITRKRPIYFCCCDGDMCNQKFSRIPKPTVPPGTSCSGDNCEQSTENPESSDPQRAKIRALSITLVALILIILVTFCYNQLKGMCHNKRLPRERLGPSPSTPEVTYLPIRLIVEKGRGQFGLVWKAEFKQETVAVKVFGNNDKASWETEMEIFELPHMVNDDILHFIGCEQRGQDLRAEFWMITAYHEKGSLYDYLNNNLITFEDLCKIAGSMVRGLSHLHEEKPADAINGVKPVIAHRDFKSKNVLLKADMSACIADFGLAIVFHSDRPCKNRHGQVGTHRYMAPEVLQGAINFSRDSFLRIDMYACALVLWELVSRCTAPIGPFGMYRMPFEQQVGANPTLGDMHDTVVRLRQRPLIPDRWRKHQAIAVLCNTIEECWDHDAEARLSAPCVSERIAGLAENCGNSTVIEIGDEDVVICK